MNDIFGQDGYLKSIIPDYEYRDEQLEMANFILERLYDAQNGLIEAGTGTGKTIAYLIPTLKYGLDNEKKIIITTETKALQKQLLDKDLPMVKRVFNEYFQIDFSFSLCLGSSNYPCRKRFESVLSKGKFTKKDLKKIESIGRLFTEGKIFTRFDVRVTGNLWNQINRESDGCNSFRCAFASKCSFQKARKMWMESDILIMNHYLFFTNIASGKTYLPQTEIVVFDEAHSIERIASAQLGFSVGYNQLLDIIALFYRKNRRNNLISNIENSVEREKSIKMIKSILKEAGIFFEKARELFGKNEYQLRIQESLKCGAAFVEALREFMILMGSVDDNFDNDMHRIEFDIARGRLFLYIESLNSFIYMGNDDYVYWMERNKKDMLGDIYLNGQPIDISEIMQRDVISYYDSSILVSATLAVGGDFSFITKRLGLERHKSIALDSTFDFNMQTVLFIAKQIVEPNNSLFIEQSAKISAEIINYLGGNCLMLFTAYRMLGEIKSILDELIDYPIYSQDDFSSSEAVEMYINNNNSVLMGTHSFWQGIDLPGDLLRGVIMMRLPFSVPDLPPVQAKIERLQEQGLNPFISLQIPEAAIRLKQGFGRLIRSRSDKGIVAMLDSRIFSRSYGKRFLKVLPECRAVYSIDELKKEYSKIIS